MKSLGLVSIIFFLNLEQQGCMSSRIITNPGVEHAGDGIFHFKQKDDYTDVTESLYDELNVFCYGGAPLSVLNFWSAVEMRLKIPSDNYHIYMERNVTMVQKQHEDSQSAWFYQVLPWKTQTIKINIFEQTCVGILTRDSYKISLMVKNVDYSFFVMTVVGIALFYWAKDLCRNVFFHYTTGVGIGIFLSLIVVVYFVQRRFHLWYSALLSYSLCIYVITSVWYNMKIYLLEHYTYVLGYLTAAGGISFALCYRMGPIENPRSLNLIQWTLQFFALGLIFASSYHQAASLSIVLLILLWEVIPARWKTRMQVQYQLKIRKPKHKLLTEEEYLDQSQETTRRELAKLRDYCKSPKADPWKITSRLQSPTRFAEFVAGSPHLTQEEILNYSHEDFDDFDEIDNRRETPTDAQMTDDDSSDESEIDLASPYDN